MLRALLLLSPWLFVVAGICLVTGFMRVAEVMTIGYEQHFVDLWEPVLGLALALLVFGIPLTIAAASGEACRVRPALAKTRMRLGPFALLLLGVGLWIVSDFAHVEAEARSHEMQAAFMADLHDYEAPPTRPVRFFEDWRETADVSRGLFCAALACFGAWFPARAGMAARTARAHGTKH